MNKPARHLPGKLILLTLAHNSSMGRFASEMAAAAHSLEPNSVLIAPALEYEPAGIERVVVGRKSPRWGRVGRIAELIRYTLEATFKTWEQARRGDALLMIYLPPSVPLSLLPLFAAKLRGAKTVLNLHDFIPHALHYPKALQALEKWFFFFAYRTFDFVAPTSSSQVPLLVTVAGLTEERIVKITHGAYPFEGVRPPPPESPQAIFLILGSLRENKRILQSIEAVAELQQEGLPVGLKIAGQPQRVEAAYWQRCQQALQGINHLTLIDRFIEESEMPEVLSGVDALLCPYEDFTSQSGVSITGLSNGLPLVATKSAGVGSLNGSVDEGISTIKTPVNKETIKTAIRKFLTDDRADRLARAATLRDKFLDHNAWKRNVELILERIHRTPGGTEVGNNH